FAAAIAIGVVAIFAVGLIAGGGDVGMLFGANWSKVDWPGVATMLLITAVLAVVLVPVARLVLPARAKGAGTALVALAIRAPLGLIAPGFAYGEGSPDDVKAAFGYVPRGLQDLSGLFNAPLSGYNLPIPFFAEANAPLWHQALGYEVSGIVGVLAIGAIVYGFAYLLRGNDKARSTSARHCAA